MTTYVTGGVDMPRPFRALRLGHFGINVDDVAAALKFYTEVLGFRIADSHDFGPRLEPARLAELGGDGRGYFMRNRPSFLRHLFTPNL
jgi:catechol 2,3-dioxygenase-like lactoylglutathione lyase family enzyme